MRRPFTYLTIYSIFFLSSAIPQIVQAQLFNESQVIAPAIADIDELYLVDLTGDGHLDLLNCDTQDLGISYYPNDGQGNFIGQFRLFNGTVRAITAGDLDDDGDEDIVAVINDGTVSNRIIWFENMENDGFSSMKIIYELGSSSYKDLSMADLDMDGDQDLLLVPVGLGLGEMILFSNDDEEVFSPTQMSEITITYPKKVICDDFDGDGLTDIIVAVNGNSGIYLIPNSGNFNTQVLIANVNNSAPSGGNSIVHGDLDNDGDLDLVFSTSGNNIVWRENNGLGNFDSAHLIEGDLSMNYSPRIIDMDDDGDLDVLALSQMEEKINWYENLENGTSWTTHEISTEYENPKLIIAGNLDSDSEIEVLATGESSNNIVEFDLIGEEYELNIAFDGSRFTNPQTIMAADMDNDGDKDIIIGPASWGSLLGGYENLGPGAFGEKTLYDNLYDGDLPNLQLKSLEGQDINGDGYTDLVYCYNSTIYTALNDGTGQLNPGEQIDNISDCPRHLTLEDIDQDGDFDLLLAKDNISWYENDGSGVFGPAILLDDQDNSYPDALMADLNLDGILDVVGAAQLEIFWMRGLGNGLFDNRITLTTGSNTINDIEVGDLTNNGYPDIVFSGQDVDIAMLVNYSGNFSGETVTIINVLENVFRVVLRDVDLDGDLDVMFADPSADIYGWVENLGSMTFSNLNIILNQIYTGYDFIAEDFDGDLDIDMISVLGILSNPNVIQRFNNVNSGCLDPSACNYNPDAAEDNGLCCYSDCGCTDPQADNFEATAICDDGSCAYIYGCTDSSAYNYDPDAAVDNATCEYRIDGIVFIDINENGNQDFGEIGIANHEVVWELSGISALTDSTGYFYFDNIFFGNHTISVSENELFPYNITPVSVTIEFGNGDSLNVNFGISNEVAIHDITVVTYTTDGMLCNDYSQYIIGVRNDGTEVISASISLEIDSLYQGYEEVITSPIDSVVDNTVFMTIDSLVPGQFQYNQVNLLNPTVNYIGEFLQVDANVWGTIDGDTVAFGQELEPFELTCSYDPNDKQVFPNGWTDDHFVQQAERLEYLIRFQNLGNAPAIDVRVQDTLDVLLDMESIEILGYSHPVYITLNSATRVIDYYFEDIFLPDAESNEEGSHGFLSFTVKPVGDIELLETVENRSYIYFDNNDPIITNTVWSTMYDCSLFEITLTWDGNLLTASEGENYQWYFSGDSITGANQQTYNWVEGLGQGIYSVSASNGFPCADTSEEVNVFADGIEEYNAHKITIYPNPFKDEAICDLGQDLGSVRMEILDVSGKLISHSNESTKNGVLRLSRQGLASGTYFIRILTSSGKRFVGSFKVD